MRTHLKACLETGEMVRFPKVRFLEAASIQHDITASVNTNPNGAFHENVPALHHIRNPYPFTQATASHHFPLTLPHRRNVSLHNKIKHNQQVIPRFHQRHAQIQTSPIYLSECSLLANLQSSNLDLTFAPARKILTKINSSVPSSDLSVDTNCVNISMKTANLQTTPQ